ncbi:MAG: BlaI/MecI/CopY family transcriptional regulator [Bryobacteraceae bacterium]
MTRKSASNLTPAELELMNILWEQGPSTVQMVADRLPAVRALAYTTVQTVLNTLHRKGKAKRVLKNRAFYYEPAVSHTRAAGQALKDMVRSLFGGSPERLVLTMLETNQLTPKQLRDLQRVVETAEKNTKGTKRERP